MRYGIGEHRVLHTQVSGTWKQPGPPPPSLVTVGTAVATGGTAPIATPGARLIETFKCVLPSPGQT